MKENQQKTHLKQEATQIIIKYRKNHQVLSKKINKTKIRMKTKTKIRIRILTKMMKAMIL